MREVIFSEGDFTLVKSTGIGVEDTPWTMLEVISDNNAAKHVIEIRLIPHGMPRYEGKPIFYKYEGAQVSHGMRMKSDTLKETEEYIESLKEALAFARRVERYIKENAEWSA